MWRPAGRGPSRAASTRSSPSGRANGRRACGARPRNSTSTSLSSAWTRPNRTSLSVNSSWNDACGKPMRKRLLLTGFLLLAASALADAQPAPTRETGVRTVETDPIRCWWRTSAGAVRIGEQFDVTLTCAVLESEGVSVVVDESRLGNAVVQMAPFEVVAGSHPADLHAGIRRFFQYDYRLRLINPDAAGTDVSVPDVALHYRVNSRVPGNAAVQGRDLLYYLPPQVMRITSLVAAGATDIRDTSGASFSSIDALTFRAGMFNIIGTALIAFGALMVLLVLIRLARGSRK